jgi:predicted HAD superfamily Cof-like phosphohydrolase
MQHWVKDIYDMHTKFGVRKAIEKLSPEELNEFLQFRIRFLEEELNETKKAAEEKDAEEVVDGLIDLCVVAIGTMDAFGVNAYQAWNKVQTANMAKEVGIKESRPNKLGLPDLIKPEGWTPPSHKGNHGKLNEL